MSPTGGPGGPPVKNLYIVLDYNILGDNGNDAKRDIIRFEGMEVKGWTGFQANSIREANQIMATKYKDQKFDNIVLETHGSTGGSIENTYSTLQSDNNKIDSSTRITYKTLRAGGHLSTEALISITNYLNEGGNLIFNSCNLGMDSRFMTEIGKATGNKFNIYFPYGKSQQEWLQSDMEGTAIYSPSKLLDRNILDEFGGYLSPKGGGEYKKINSLKINSDGGVQCED